MRAYSSCDELQYLGDVVQLPQPRYAVGTRINVRGLPADQLRYYARTIVRQVLRNAQPILYRLKKQGYMPGMVGKKMLPGNKAKIRQILELVFEADSVELAGTYPQGVHVTGTVSNQCYLQRGQTHSGVDHIH